MTNGRQLSFIPMIEPLSEGSEPGKYTLGSFLWPISYLVITGVWAGHMCYPRRAPATYCDVERRKKPCV